VISAEYPKEVRNIDDSLGTIRSAFFPGTLVKGVDAGLPRL